MMEKTPVVTRITRKERASRSPRIAWVSNAKQARLPLLKTKTSERVQKMPRSHSSSRTVNVW